MTVSPQQEQVEVSYRASPVTGLTLLPPHPRQIQPPHLFNFARLPTQQCQMMASREGPISAELL